MTINKNPDWYLLFGGTSEDGRGVPVYKSRTTLPEAALTFYRKEIKAGGGYSTGKVEKITDRTIERMSEESLKEEVKKQNRETGLEKRRATLAAKKLAEKAGANPSQYGRFA